MKKCTACGMLGTPKHFYKHKTSPDGLTYACKSCSSKAAAKHERDNWKRYYSVKKARKARLNPPKPEMSVRERFEQTRIMKAKWKQKNADRVRESRRKYELKLRRECPDLAKKLDDRRNSKRVYGDLWEAHRVFLDTQRKLKKEGLV